METIKEKLRNHLLNEVLTEDEPADFSDDFDLIDSGLLDSLGTMSLISHIQNEFDFELKSTEITEENFKSINAIASLVDKGLHT